MATLSMFSTLGAAFKITRQRLLGGHFWRPAKLGLQFVIAVASLLPVRMPPSPIEDRWQLSLGPFRVLFPPVAERVAHHVRQVDGGETSDIFLIQTQKLAARREVIVDDIEDLTIDSFHQASQNDCFRAIVHIGEGQGVGTADMQKESE